MKKLVLLVLALAPLLGHAQSRVVLNDDAFLNITNGAFLVIDNPNANALSTAGAGGHIVSEDEGNRIRWNIATSTGNYVLPWSTNSNVKIPLEVNVGTAGSGAGAIDFSTYETTTDANTPWAPGITNMDNGGFGDALAAIDRFWLIDTANYTTNPAVTISFGYDDASNELGGTNTIVEGNLVAQRWNPNVNNWEGRTFGSADAVANRVSNSIVSANDFYPVWTLVDRNAPLPAELTAFDVNCNTESVEVTWSTASETNNDFFELEKSYDGLNFFHAETVLGSGTSSWTNRYRVTDPGMANGITYYRLKQVDFDGTTSYHPIAATTCKTSGLEVGPVRVSHELLAFNVEAEEEEILTLYLYTNHGSLVATKTVAIFPGQNNVALNQLNLSAGIYLLSVAGERSSFSLKVMKP